MSKHAYLVTGPESSGNRYLARLCIQAGCAGDASTQQAFDREPPLCQERVVWIRSLPHAGRWPDLDGLVALLRGRDYEVQALIPVRCPVATARSQIGVGHVGSVAQALANRNRGLTYALAAYATLKVPALVIPLEGLILHPKSIPQVLALVGLKLGGPAEFTWPYDVNLKHYARDAGV
jgi:hypothetical protein